MKDIVILAGGKGTRLKGYTGSLPKPLVKVSGYHFLDYILFTISKYCFKNIYIIAGYKGGHIKKKYDGKFLTFVKYTFNWEKTTWNWRSFDEIKKKIKDDFFNEWDTVCDVNFLNLVEHSKKKLFRCFSSNKNVNYKNNKKLNNLKLEKKI